MVLSGVNDDDGGFFFLPAFCVSCVSVTFFEIKLFKPKKQQQQQQQN